MLALENTSDIGTVHPHGRGDNTDADVGEATLTGSPPRAWGQ